MNNSNGTCSPQGRIRAPPKINWPCIWILRTCFTHCCPQCSFEPPTLLKALELEYLKIAAGPIWTRKESRSAIQHTDTSSEPRADTVTHLSLSESASAPNVRSSNGERREEGSAFHVKVCPFSVFLLDPDGREKLKRKIKRVKQKEPGRFYVLSSNHITKSLIASREFTSLFGRGIGGGQRKKEGREGHGSCFLKQCYKKVVKKPLLFTSG